MPLRISQTALDLSMTSNRIKGLIMAELNKSHDTVIGYIKRGDQRLALRSVAEIISQETGIPFEQVLIDEPVIHKSSKTQAA